MSSKRSNWFPEGFILLPKPQAYDLLPGQDLLIAGTPSFWTGGNKLEITSRERLNISVLFEGFEASYFSM